MTPKASKVYTKYIVCLPLTKGPLTKPIAIPRGESRVELAELGLVGKISISAGWKSTQVAQEISSVFASAFRLGEDDVVPFEYLR